MNFKTPLKNLIIAAALGMSLSGCKFEYKIGLVASVEETDNLGQSMQIKSDGNNYVAYYKNKPCRSHLIDSYFDSPISHSDKKFKKGDEVRFITKYPMITEVFNEYGHGKLCSDDIEILKPHSNRQ